MDRELAVLVMRDAAMNVRYAVERHGRPVASRVVRLAVESNRRLAARSISQESRLIFTNYAAAMETAFGQ